MKVSAFPLVFAVLLVSLGGIAQGENGEEEEEIVDYDDFAETSDDMPAVEKRSSQCFMFCRNVSHYLHTLYLSQIPQTVSV